MQNRCFMKRGVIVMSLLGLLSSWSCANHSATYRDAHITSFSYHFDGTIGGNSHTYEVKVKDGVATILVRDMRHHDYDDMTDTIDMSLVDSLAALCAKHDVLRWDGYDKYNRHIHDGHGFSLSVRYDDGKNMSAHGMNMSPSGFWDFDEELHELFAPLCEQLCAKALAEKKARGVKGNVKFILANFSNHGVGDEYSVMLSPAEIRDYNFDVKIISRTGEFFPKGEYRYVSPIPDEAIDWKAFTKLAQKHHLVEWMDWEKSAENYNECEWFQIGWSFEEGHINAMGTLHPEGYEAFRKDFLKLLVKTVEQATTKYHVELYK